MSFRDSIAQRSPSRNGFDDTESPQANAAGAQAARIAVQAKQYVPSFIQYHRPPAEAQDRKPPTSPKPGKAHTEAQHPTHGADRSDAPPTPASEAKSPLQGAASQVLMRDSSPLPPEVERALAYLNGDLDVAPRYTPSPASPFTTDLAGVQPGSGAGQAVGGASLSQWSVVDRTPDGHHDAQQHSTPVKYTYTVVQPPASPLPTATGSTAQPQQPAAEQPASTVLHHADGTAHHQASSPMQPTGGNIQYTSTLPTGSTHMWSNNPPVSVVNCTPASPRPADTLPGVSVVDCSIASSRSASAHPGDDCSPEVSTDSAAAAAERTVMQHAVTVSPPVSKMPPVPVPQPVLPTPTSMIGRPPIATRRQSDVTAGNSLESPRVSTPAYSMPPRYAHPWIRMHPPKLNMIAIGNTAVVKRFASFLRCCIPVYIR